MKYILLIYGDERVWESFTDEQKQEAYTEHGLYAKAMEAEGILRGGAELKPVTTATSIRFTGGRRKTIDGPFAETREQLGGYYLIETENLEQAIEWAEKMPCMTEGTVEIRPLGEEG